MGSILRYKNSKPSLVIDLGPIRLNRALIFLLTLTMISCGGGKEEDAPPASGHAILPSAGTLPAPTLTFPTTSPYSSNGGILTVTGVCTPGDGGKVFLGGDENQKTSCSSSGLFSFAINKPNDGTFTYTLRQESLTQHPSDTTTFVWVRTTLPPDPPTITTPASYPYSSNSNSFTIAGACAAGHTVSVIGDWTETKTCSQAGAYSFTVSKALDGSYAFEVFQTDSSGNSSTHVQTSWTKTGTPPAAPVITSPANPYTGSDNLITVAGTCPTGTTVKLTGSTVLTSGCSNGTFSIDVSETTYTTFNYQLVSVNSFNISSSTVPFQWIRSATAPSTPVLSAPSPATLQNNLDSLLIAGSCTTGLIVSLTGSDSQSTTCSGSSFSFSVSKTTDAAYNFSVYQTNGGVNSGAATVSWTRDTLPPLAPVITAPGISPYSSSTGTLNIAGTCESGTTVNLNGDATGTTSCVSGGFTLNVTKATGAPYNFTVSQTDGAGNTSSGTALQWIYDATPPSTPTMTSPATSPYYSNGNSLTVAGACETSATVYLTGDSTQNMTCASSAYSFSVPKSLDGTYTFTVSQTDGAGNSSGSISKQWIRDTVAPSAPTVTYPATSPFTASSNFSLSGACETGASVTLSGAQSSSTTCAAGTYTFSLSQSTDGTYNYSVQQADLAANTSSGTSFQWIRLSSAPAIPTITSPSTNPYYGKLNTLTVTGGCETGNTIEISGAQTLTASCTSSAYSVVLNQSTDGSYVYTIKQRNLSNILSNAASLTWIIDTVAPSPLTISTPAATPTYSSTNSVTISGTCETNATVNYSGAATGTTACTAGGTYSMTITKTTDGTHAFTLNQTDLAGNTSSSVTQTWVRDTLPPATPVLTQPNANPYTSGDTNLNIAGTCELGSTVYLSGASTQNVACTALGTFSFSVTKSVDGTYNYSLLQKDLALNSSPALSFTWNRDTSFPVTPVITAPASNPYYSNGSTLSISVTCQTGLTPSNAIVTISGVSAAEVTSPAGATSQDCVSSPVTFVIQKSVDGNYNLTFTQENPNNGNISAESLLTWVRDSAAPAAPVVNSPASSPYTAPGNINLSGDCEAFATVYVTGDSTQNMLCSGGTFSFSIIKAVDATYTFNVTQKDLANNTSAATTRVWVRNSDSLPAPVITFPATATYSSNNGSLTLSGTCQPNYTLTLGGDILSSEVQSPSGSLTQVCPSNGSFNYTLSKSTDGPYYFEVDQTFNGVTSTPATLDWTLDTTAPTLTLSTTATNPNLVNTITFTFSADETATFQCKLGSGTYQSCTSPATYSSLTNGSLSFSVIATDSVGNASAASTYSWSQAAYNVIALYHLNSGTASELADSGLFTANNLFNNNLTAVNAPAAATGKLPTAAPKGFTLASSKYFEVANNSSLNTMARNMSIEGFFKFSTLSTTSGAYHVLWSNTGSASPNLGWELRLGRASGCTTGKYKLTFVGSLNGTTQTSVVSSTTCFSLSTNTWYYVGLTYSLGTVKFYMGTTTATSRGSGTIGTAGSSVLNIPNVPFRIGYSPVAGSTATSAVVDEVRLSNMVQTISVPTSEITAN